jgi:hypothetical protein
MVVVILMMMAEPSLAQDKIGLIPLPDPQYKRVQLDPDSFGSWLRRLSLKPAGSPVLDYRSRIYKTAEDSVVGAVVAMDISGRRMEQCMDVLVRLYAEYLWQQSQAIRLKLPLPGRYWLAWQDWAAGLRPRYRGTHVSLIQNSTSDHSEANYRAYLREVYAASATQQFYYSYQSLDREMAQPGDFIVKKGRKRHAVMIVDIARNPEGEEIALIGHGDTPACQFFLLRYSEDNLWFPLGNGKNVLPLPIRRKMTWDGLRRFELPKDN